MTGRFFPSVFLFFFLTLSLFSNAANVTVFGLSKDYAGKELEFFIYTERIFDSYESLSKTIVDSTGSFSVSFSLDVTKCVYCQTPLYTAFIYAEPGKTYEVNLPPSSGKTAENSNNPFFIAPLWHMLPISGPDNGKPGLNELIDSFNRQFDPFLDKQILRYYNPQHNREKLDSFILTWSSFPESENPEYFLTYRLYKLATLGFMETQFNYADLCEKYLKNKPEFPDVPSWWEFFNFYFDGYLSSLSTKKEYSQLYSLIGKGKYYDLNQLLKTDSALQNDQIRELAILKEIYKVYYVNSLPLNTLINLCDSLSANSSNILSHSIADILKKEAAKLLIGNLPPHAILKDSDGNSLDVSSVRGKYTYLGFCSIDNLGCQKEFEYLKYFYHKHNKYLDLLVILPETEKDRIISYSEDNSIPWKFWYPSDNSKILKDFNVKAYPVFYILDRDGKFIMSPAILPSAGFEKQLFNILKSRNEI